MTKVKLTLTVDDQLIAHARMLGVNLSSLLEDVLRGDELRRRRSSADLSASIWKKEKRNSI